jgi:4-amino-4-deoxy-L-arabinose transferase-like glycosyltransferase
LTAGRSADDRASGRVWFASATRTGRVIWPLLLALVIAPALKLWLMAQGGIPFNSDEAIVGLMARHILQGQRPVFFYGQAYMGSLDAWLVAGAFRLFGTSVDAIRWVQILLFDLYLVTVFIMAKQWTGDKGTAGLAAVLAAVPPVVVTTYTTATLGGYGETLVLGNLTLILAYRVASPSRDSRLLWFVLGLVGGLAFWTLGLSAVYLLPAAMLLFWRHRLRALAGYLTAAVGFVFTSAPWWMYNWSHGGAALAVLTTDSPIQSSIGQRLVGFLVLGVPALLGLRFPWSPAFIPWYWLVVGVWLYAGMVLYVFVSVRQGTFSFSERARKLAYLLPIVFVLLFVGTQFGIDATGRYLLPLYGWLVILFASFVRAALEKRRVLGALAMVGILAINLTTNVSAGLSADRITTQFDPITRFDNRYDDELIAFLMAHKLTRGYTNYWVTFRLAFLTDETIQLAPRLPYKVDLRYTSKDDRYPAYSLAASEATHIAYVTTQHPVLDAKLSQAFRGASVGYKEKDIGPYHVFYDLSRTVTPSELGF